ncbi:MAG TPA: YjdF family protein [Rectinemataceae bacterium]|nr:YjdF family protein [Rectinemataceae bacterium]
MTAIFSIFYEGPFWVGVLEVHEGERLVVGRHVFGSEPSNAELLEFMLHRFHHIPRHVSSIGAPPAIERSRGAKRAIRAARRESRRPASTRAQAALSAALETRQAADKARRRDESAAQERIRYEKRDEKRREKRRGH